MNAIATTTSALPTSPLQVRSDVVIRVATMADLPFMDALQKRHSKQLGYFPTKQFEGYIAQGAVLVADGLGYVIAKDRYLKRDELGVVYQLCVAPGNQRKQVGAALVKAVFERSAYGCRLYCCWCAQDIEANRFWESMGFLPIAFRAGSEKKSRVHIFWQRRINADDATTPYWFPSKTESGAIREDRLVFPIPPGTHWSEVKAVRVPSCGTGPVLEDRRHGLKTRATKDKKPPTPAPRRLFFGRPPSPAPAESTKPRRERKPKAKADPKLVAAARELRDRYLEHVNQVGALPPVAAKYDVSRTLPAMSAAESSAIEGSKALPGLSPLALPDAA